MRRTALIALGLTAALGLAACSSNSSSSSSSSSGGGTTPVTLTLWHNYGTEANATATVALVKAFEAANPGVTINVVSQPAANYFALLKAAAISKTGPDLAVSWTGLFTLQDKSYMANLKGNIPAADLARMKGLEWMSDGLNASNATYVMPLEDQFYMGFYNKALFAKAGVMSMPTDWAQMDAACTKLKAIGVTPIVYGNGGQSLGTEFYPWYDASYMMMILPVSQWVDLYNGNTRWNSPAVEAQFAQWAKLQSSGCTNNDVLTKTDNLTDFEKGKAAMMIDGTWDSQAFTTALGSKLAPIPAPYTPTPQKGVVEFPGDGFSVMNYSQHQAEAFKFLDFLTTPAAAAIINKAGLIPDQVGTTTTLPVNQEMLNFVAKQGYTAYPMLDNVTAGNVVNSGNTVLPSILANKTSPASGLGQMNTVWQTLPTGQHGMAYGQ